MPSLFSFQLQEEFKMSNKIDLAKKLQALAERGEGGEKMNAQKMLEDFIKKNGITEEDLGSIERTPHTFKVPADLHRLFFQIVYQVQDVSQFTYHLKDGNARRVIIECSEAEAINIKIMFRWYSEQWEKEKELFFKAFICKNNLYSSKPGRSENELSPEELDEVMRIREMVGVVKNQKHHKRLES
jgi:hypothetical protein